MVAMAVDGYFSTKLNNRKMIMFLWGIIAFCLSLIYVVLKFL
jgi:flagellar biogenesis protein FliO